MKIITLQDFEMHPEQFKGLPIEEQAARYRNYLIYSAIIQMIICAGQLSCCWLIYYYISILDPLGMMISGFATVFMFFVLAFIFPTFWEMYQMGQKFEWVREYQENKEAYLENLRNL